MTIKEQLTGTVHSDFTEYNSNSVIFGKWFDHYAFRPHISIDSKKIIWPGTHARRRMVYYYTGIIKFEWITEKECVYRKLKGEQ